MRQLFPRFDPPVQFTGRVMLEDMRIEGQPARKGQAVLTLIGGANRDWRVIFQAVT